MNLAGPLNLINHSIIFKAEKQLNFIKLEGNLYLFLGKMAIKLWFRCFFFKQLKTLLNSLISYRQGSYYKVISLTPCKIDIMTYNYESKK